jgi:adenylate cyclase class IV
MYEVEIKVELTRDEKDILINEFKKRGFVEKGVTPQNDYYIEAQKSQYKGYDLKRYRNEAGKYIYTQKTWEVINGDPIRKEDEHEVTEEEFKKAVVDYPNALKIIKDRAWFDGSFEDTKMSITIDSVKFDHSKEMRHFVEAEIDVHNKEDVTKTKDLIREFLKDILKRSEIPDIPGMFTMAFEKR